MTDNINQIEVLEGYAMYDNDDQVTYTLDADLAIVAEYTHTVCRTTFLKFHDSYYVNVDLNPGNPKSILLQRLLDDGNISHDEYEILNR